jgi:hypothetical protein
MKPQDMYQLLSFSLKALAVSALGSVNAYAAAPNDFDGDGISDMARVEFGADDSLIWKASLSTSGATTDLGTLGKKGDHLVMAQWVGSGTQIGAVSESASDDSLVWTVQNTSGAPTQFTFGKKGDLVVAGGDFNGNGVADAAVVRLVGGKAIWQVVLDPLISGIIQPTEVSFGKTGDRAFYARADGSGLDWIGVIGKGKGNRSAGRMKNLVTGEVKRFNRLPRIASQGTRPRAFPIRQASGPDLLGFQIASGGNTRIIVTTIAGVTVYSGAFQGSGISVVGDFNSGSGYEVAYQDARESAVVNPVSSDRIQASSLDGVAVDEVNLNVVGSSSSGGSNSGGGSGSDSSGGSSGGSVAQCSTITSWPNGHIYKTIGSEHFFDVRRNTIGIVVKPGGRGPFPSCVQAIDIAGNVVAQLGLYARGAGWEARYYAGVGCGTGTPFNGSTVANRARAKTGSGSIYMNFGGTCYGPINAAVCIGSKQC